MWVAFLVEGLRSLLATFRRELAPPPISALDFIADFWGFSIAFAVIELELLDHLKDGARSSQQIAEAARLSEDRVYRLLRGATQIDLVKEKPGSVFQLKPIGRALCKDADNIRDYLLYMGRYGMPFWSGLPAAIRERRTAVQLQMGKPLFEAVESDLRLAESFNRGMSAVSNVAIDCVLAVYSFSRFKRIVDLGGGHGRMLSGILSTVPLAKGVLFDLPSVVAKSLPVLREHQVVERCEVVGGSFFDQVPDSGDLYMMKTIIHDWEDDDAIKILKNVRRAMAGDGRVLLIETVVPGPGIKHFAKVLDLEMIVSSGGRERTREEYSKLLEASGFKLVRVIPTAAPLSLIEATPC